MPDKDELIDGIDEIIAERKDVTNVIEFIVKR